MAAAFFDLLGTALTLLTLALLAAGGYLAAVRLLGRRAVEDPLEFAMAWLLAVTAEAVGIALLIGALGLLRLEVGLAAQALLTLALLSAGPGASPPKRSKPRSAFSEPAPGRGCAKRRRCSSSPRTPWATRPCAACCVRRSPGTA